MSGPGIIMSFQHDHVWSRYEQVKSGMIMSGPGMIM